MFKVRLYRSAEYFEHLKRFLHPIESIIKDLERKKLIYLIIKNQGDFRLDHLDQIILEKNDKCENKLFCFFTATGYVHLIN